MAEKVKLTILQVKDVQKVGEKQREKLSFQARDAEGKELWYFTFRTTLFDAIRNGKDKEIEVDVEVKSREYDGTTYWDRNVSQVYDAEGKPIAPVESKGQGSRQWYGKSPEEIATIEAQVAAKIEGEKEIAAAEIVERSWIAGKLTDDSPLVVGMYNWIWHLLGPGLKEGAKPLDKPIDTPRQAPVEGEKVRLEMFKAQCKRYGWDFSTKKGGDGIAGWLDSRPEGLRWKELSAEGQELAVEQMRKLADEKEATS